MAKEGGLSRSSTSDSLDREMRSVASAKTPSYGPPRKKSPDELEELSIESSDTFHQLLLSTKADGLITNTGARHEGQTPQALSAAEVEAQLAAYDETGMEDIYFQYNFAELEPELAAVAAVAANQRSMLLQASNGGGRSSSASNRKRLARFGRGGGGLKRERAHHAREALRATRAAQSKEADAKERSARRDKVPEDLRFSPANVVSYRTPSERPYESAGTFYVQPFAVLAPPRRVTLTEQRWRKAGLLPGATATQNGVAPPQPGTKEAEAASEQRRHLLRLEASKIDTARLLRKPVGGCSTPLHVAAPKAPKPTTLPDFSATLAATWHRKESSLTGGGGKGGFGSSSGSSSSLNSSNRNLTSQKISEPLIGLVPLKQSGSSVAGAHKVASSSLSPSGRYEKGKAKLPPEKPPEYPYHGRLTLDSPTWDLPVDAQLLHKVDTRGLSDAQVSSQVSRFRTDGTLLSEDDLQGEFHRQRQTATGGSREEHKALKHAVARNSLASADTSRGSSRRSVVLELPSSHPATPLLRATPFHSDVSSPSPHSPSSRAQRSAVRDPKECAGVLPPSMIALSPAPRDDLRTLDTSERDLLQSSVPKRVRSGQGSPPKSVTTVELTENHPPHSFLPQPKYDAPIGFRGDGTATSLTTLPPSSARALPGHSSFRQPDPRPSGSPLLLSPPPSSPPSPGAAGVEEVNSTRTAEPPSPLSPASCRKSDITNALRLYAASEAPPLVPVRLGDEFHLAHRAQSPTSLHPGAQGLELDGVGRRSEQSFDGGGGGGYVGLGEGTGGLGDGDAALARLCVTEWGPDTAPPAMSAAETSGVGGTVGHGSDREEGKQEARSDGTASGTAAGTGCVNESSVSAAMPGGLLPPAGSAGGGGSERVESVVSLEESDEEFEGMRRSSLSSSPLVQHPLRLGSASGMWRGSRGQPVPPPQQQEQQQGEEGTSGEEVAEEALTTTRFHDDEAAAVEVANALKPFAGEEVGEKRVATPRDSGGGGSGNEEGQEGGEEEHNVVDDLDSAAVPSANGEAVPSGAGAGSGTAIDVVSSAGSGEVVNLPTAAEEGGDDGDNGAAEQKGEEQEEKRGQHAEGTPVDAGANAQTSDDVSNNAAPSAAPTPVVAAGVSEAGIGATTTAGNESVVFSSRETATEVAAALPQTIAPAPAPAAKEVAESEAAVAGETIEPTAPTPFVGNEGGAEDGGAEGGGLDVDGERLPALSASATAELRAFLEHSVGSASASVSSGGSNSALGSNRDLLGDGAGGGGEGTAVGGAEAKDAPQLGVGVDGDNDDVGFSGGGGDVLKGGGASDKVAPPPPLGSSPLRVVSSPSSSSSSSTTGNDGGVGGTQGGCEVTESGNGNVTPRGPWPPLASAPSQFQVLASEGHHPQQHHHHQQYPQQHSLHGPLHPSANALPVHNIVEETGVAAAPSRPVRLPAPSIGAPATSRTQNLKRISSTANMTALDSPSWSTAASSAPAAAATSPTSAGLPLTPLTDARRITDPPTSGSVALYHEAFQRRTDEYQAEVYQTHVRNTKLAPMFVASPRESKALQEAMLDLSEHNDASSRASSSRHGSGNGPRSINNGSLGSGLSPLSPGLEWVQSVPSLTNYNAPSTPLGQQQQQQQQSGQPPSTPAPGSEEAVLARQTEGLLRCVPMPVLFGVSQQELSGMTRLERRAYFNRNKHGSTSRSGLGQQQQQQQQQEEEEEEEEEQGDDGGRFESFSGRRIATVGGASSGGQGFGSGGLERKTLQVRRLHKPVPITESFKRELLKQMFHANINKAEAASGAKLLRGGGRRAGAAGGNAGVQLLPAPW